MSQMITAEQVLHFWFEEISPKSWWIKDPEFDALIQSRFEDLLKQAKRGELADWRVTPQGRLAEIIVLDQFSRNIYRDTPAPRLRPMPSPLSLPKRPSPSWLTKHLSQNKCPFYLCPTCIASRRLFIKLR